MIPRLSRHLKPLHRLHWNSSKALVPRLRVPLERLTNTNGIRYYAQGPSGGGFPGGLQFGMDKMEKGQALKEFVSEH